MIYVTVDLQSEPGNRRVVVGGGKLPKMVVVGNYDQYRMLCDWYGGEDGEVFHISEPILAVAAGAFDAPPEVVELCRQLAGPLLESDPAEMESEACYGW